MHAGCRPRRLPCMLGRSVARTCDPAAHHRPHTCCIAVGAIAYSLAGTNITCVPAAAQAAPAAAQAARAPAPSPLEPTTRLVSTGAELLEALQQAAAAPAPGSSTVELTGSVALTAQDTAALTLPLTIGPNRTLELRGGTGQHPALLSLWAGAAWW